MKTKPAYLLISLSMFIGMGLIGCSAGGSSTGTSELSQITHSREVIRPYYPEAADYPIAISNEWPEFYGWYEDGVIYLSSLWLHDYEINKYASCTIVHEWAHSLQPVTVSNTEWRDIAEVQAEQLEDKCVSKLT